ncbi:hypothetical protein HBI39_211710 [Parastagonospora nodorum]|nr:hypothetical protein HBI79_101240 [Parastagonospora nodorum]KAH6288886.1 hypothetical protein HBI39_211710 [Parastagonospora nodorum]
MPIQDAIPLGGTGEVLAAKTESAIKATRDTAAKIATSAAGIAKVVREIPITITTYELEKDSIKDVKGDGGISSVLPPNKATSVRGYQSHSRMLGPLLAAFVLMAYVSLTSLIDFRVSGSQYGILVALFLIMGESILPKTLANVSPTRPADDVAYFSMGWLSWTLSAIVTAVSGNAELLPKPEVSCKVLNLNSAQGRANDSFLLSRILHDLELKHAQKTDGLAIEVLDALDLDQTLKTTDMSTQVVMYAQVSFMLCAMFWHNNWQVLFLSTIGGLFIDAIAKMPAWQAQTFSARRDNGKNATYALMRGNGHNHVFIIRNTHANTYNLEDLAGAAVTRYDYTSSLELFVLGSALVGFFWLAAASMTLSTPATMYLLAIMGVGTIGNIRTVALPRSSAAHGIPLKTVDVITGIKVLGAIQALEQKYEGCGEPLLKEFFPGGVKDQDQAWFDDLKESRKCKVEVVEEADELSETML